MIPGKRKYRNTPTIIDGIKFDSRLEASRYSELRLLEKSGDISHLQWQVRYKLTVNGVHITTYVADFVYTDKSGSHVVEDTKSAATITPVYRIKEKLMRAVLGITIRRVYASGAGK